MAALVIDASIASAWCFPDERTDYTHGVFQAVTSSLETVAPRLWAYEIRNSILMGFRRGRISKPDAEQFLASLNELNVRLSEPSSYDGVFGLADQHGLTVYDAAYLDLAVHEGVPLASLDGQLIRAAQKVGVAFSALTLNREPCSIIRVFSAPHAEAQLRRIATTRYSHTPAARPGSAVSIPRGGGTLRSTAARLR